MGITSGIKSGTRTIGKNIRTGVQRTKHIAVDVSNRLQRSFGEPVKQMVEIHYDGRPLTFVYSGPLERISVEVMHKEQGLAAEAPEKFDLERRRLDLCEVRIGCTACNQAYKATMETHNVLNPTPEILMRALPKAGKSHYRRDHIPKLETAIVETEEIRPENRIKKFHADRISFIRTFPTKTAEIRYLSLYDQDMLAEAPQVQYKKTSAGSEYMKKSDTFFTIFVACAVELLGFILMALTLQPTYYSPTPTMKVDYAPWIILLFVLIGAVGAIWRERIKATANTWVKFVELEAATYEISNKGVLPVIMKNSNLEPMWDYQARVMGITPAAAEDVFHSLQNWSDDDMARLHRANEIGKVEGALNEIEQGITRLKTLDYNYRHPEGDMKLDYRVIGAAIAGTVILYTVILMFAGIL